MELQNEDGGWPTFYRDDALLRRDESGTDVLAQALSALAAWRRDWRSDTSNEAKRRWSFIDERAARAIESGWKYLESHQQDDGSFIPLWFGNENQPNEPNPVYGTAQVLLACAELERLESNCRSAPPAGWWPRSTRTAAGDRPARRSIILARKKMASRTWRANDAMAKFCTVEETSLAITALIPLADSNPTVSQAVSRGLTWLTTAVEQDAHRRPAIIGFSPSKLWYHERLYPLAFAAGRCRERCAAGLQRRPLAVARLTAAVRTDR